MQAVSFKWGIDPTINGYWAPEPIMVKIFTYVMTSAQEARKLTLVCKTWRDLSYLSELQKIFILLEIMERLPSIVASGETDRLLCRVATAFLKLKKPELGKQAIQMCSETQSAYVLRARRAFAEFFSTLANPQKIQEQIKLVGSEAAEIWNMEFVLAVLQNWPDGTLEALKDKAGRNPIKLFRIAQIESQINRKDLITTITQVINGLIDWMGTEPVEPIFREVIEKISEWRENKILTDLDFLKSLFERMKEKIGLKSENLRTDWFIVLAELQAITYPEDVPATLSSLDQTRINEYAYKIVEIKVRIGDLEGAWQIILDRPKDKLYLIYVLANAISRNKNSSIRDQLPKYVQEMEQAALDDPKKHDIWTLVEFITNLGDEKRAQAILKEAFDKNPDQMLQDIIDSRTDHFYRFADKVLAFEVAGKMLQLWIDKWQADRGASEPYMWDVIFTATTYNPAMGRRAAKCISIPLQRLDAMFSAYFPYLY